MCSWWVHKQGYGELVVTQCGLDLETETESGEFPPFWPAWAGCQEVTPFPTIKALTYLQYLVTPGMGELSLTQLHRLFSC